MHRIVIQYAVPKKIPGMALLKRWANGALSKKKSSAELTIRIVGLKEMTELNSSYRRKSGPTNVLSFPNDMPEIHAESRDFLGDIVICANVVNREAKEQDKLSKAHWAHMVVHGTLHLLGHDHVKEKDAVKMETLEIRILKSLGFPNPYKLSEKIKKVNKNGRGARSKRK